MCVFLCLFAIPYIREKIDPSFLFLHIHALSLGTLLWAFWPWSLPLSLSLSLMTPSYDLNQFSPMSLVEDGDDHHQAHLHPFTTLPNDHNTSPLPCPIFFNTPQLQIANDTDLHLIQHQTLHQQQEVVIIIYILSSPSFIYMGICVILLIFYHATSFLNTFCNIDYLLLVLNEQINNSWSPNCSYSFQFIDHFLIQESSNFSASNTNDIAQGSLCDQQYTRNEEDQRGSGKWMSSKMRIMRKMMNPDGIVSKKPRRSKQLVQDQQNQQASQASSNSDGVVRVCSDCNTTKTPLWRSGPCGPKVSFLQLLFISHHI